MNCKLLIAVITCLIAGLSSTAKPLKDYVCNSQGSSIGFTVDSIDFRTDLVRVYGKLTGIPHTSNRIDNMTMAGGNSKAAAAWTDIEGVDMKRWFQWEDSGSINVEIDFPAMKPASVLTIMLSGPKGPSTWKISRAANKRKTHRK